MAKIVLKFRLEKLMMYLIGREGEKEHAWPRDWLGQGTESEKGAFVAEWDWNVPEAYQV